jgi:phosphohistidine phosphatase
VKVYFLRHGIAADRDEWKGDDASRPLTAEGRERMEREAKALAKIGLDPGVIVTSPLVRARQTAEILADALKIRGKLVEDERVAQNFDRAKLAGVLQDHAGVESVLVVGHEPDFSALVGEVVGGAAIVLKKGGIACVELASASAPAGELLWLVPPKVLV